MSMSSTTDRLAPSADSLIIQRRIGDALICIGVAVFVYWTIASLYNWTQTMNYYYDSVFTLPAVEWYLAIPFIILGYILASRSRKKLHYWHRYVESGMIVDKHIEHYSEYSVGYVVYVKGTTRAGNTGTYGHHMSHGKYELQKIGDRISFPE